MFSHKKIIGILVATVTTVFIAIFATQAIRESLANDDIAAFKQEVESIRNYPNAHSAGSTADKGLLTEAMRYDDKNYEAPLLYAKTLHNEGKYDESLKLYQKAIALRPDSTESYWCRSQCYAALKKYDQAIADMTDCIRIDPSTYDYYFTRARLYGSINDRIAAIKDYDEILNRENTNHPKYVNYAMVLNNKAYSLIELEKYYEALPLLNRAISLQQNNDTFYGSRGELYYTVGDYDKSYNDFTRAIRLIEANKGKSGCDDPSSYYHYRGLLHSRMGALEAARLDLQKAVNMGSIKAAEPLHQVEQIIGKSLIENI